MERTVTFFWKCTNTTHIYGFICTKVPEELDARIQLHAAVEQQIETYMVLLCCALMENPTSANFVLSEWNSNRVTPPIRGNHWKTRCHFVICWDHLPCATCSSCVVKKKKEKNLEITFIDMTRVRILHTNETET